MSSDPSLGELYDWEVAAVAGRGDEDVRWLTGLAGQRRVLELACGTGRVAVPLARAGATVVGLDRDQTMLAAVPAHPRLRLVRADMRAFAFATGFDLIALPYNALQLLLRDEDRLACLGCARKHLAPGGIVALEVTDFLHDVVQTSVPREPVGAGTVAGRPVELHGGLDHDLDRRVTHYRRRFVIGGDAVGVTVDHDVSLYSFRPGEMEDLLTRAGLAGRAEPVRTAVTRWVAGRLGDPREPGG